MVTEYKPLVREFPIEPKKINGIIEMVPISELKSGKIEEKSFKISQAIVAYLDILGFSNKKDEIDIENCLMDYTGVMSIASHYYSKIRFNIFSDCAFISTSIENAVELLSALRFVFKQLVGDCTLVRGGLALGTFNEIRSGAQKEALGNLNSSMFSGSGVVKAVKLEESGSGAFLFTDKECAEFYNKNYGEHIISLDDRQILGWATDESSLIDFVSASLLRLLKLLSVEDGGDNKPIIEKFVNNIRYAFTICEEPLFAMEVIKLILSLPIISKELRRKVLLEIGLSDIQLLSNKKVDDWLRKDNFRIFIALADSDSSLPASPLLGEIIKPYSNQN
jgi:hypothetical protein